MMILRALVLVFLATLATIGVQAAEVRYYPVPRGSHPHDVAADPGPGGVVYYTAQHTGKLGILDPSSGRIDEIVLGQGSAPHGVIVGPDGAAWITDSGQNAIVRVDAKTRVVKVWPLPREGANANLNTAAFDRSRRQRVVERMGRQRDPAL
jgi:virginiamycin B lyase